MILLLQWFPTRTPTLSTLALIYNYGCGELDLLYNLYYGVGRAVFELAARKIREGIWMDNFPASEQAQWPNIFLCGDRTQEDHPVNS